MLWLLCNSLGWYFSHSWLILRTFLMTWDIFFSIENVSDIWLKTTTYHWTTVWSLEKLSRFVSIAGKWNSDQVKWLISFRSSSVCRYATGTLSLSLFARYVPRWFWSNCYDHGFIELLFLMAISCTLKNTDHYPLNSTQSFLSPCIFNISGCIRVHAVWVASVPKVAIKNMDTTTHYYYIILCPRMSPWYIERTKRGLREKGDRITRTSIPEKFLFHCYCHSSWSVSNGSQEIYVYHFCLPSYFATFAILSLI